MKALIVYASWFGHNRTVAQALAAELTRRGLTVACGPASRITASDAIGVELLVLGTYTHGGKASRRLRKFCEAIPQRRFEHITIAAFGTQMMDNQQPLSPGGIDDLQTCLAARGCDLAIAPLRIGLSPGAAFLPMRRITATQHHQIEAFAAELWEASVPAPLM